AFEYCTDLFKPETIQRFILYFKNVINRTLENKECLISEIEIITEAEKIQVLENFNNTGTEYPRNKTIPQLFAEQAEQTPDYIGLHDTGLYWTAWMHDCMDGWGSRGRRCRDVARNVSTNYIF
ncbi:MAG: hypothetical protein MUF15_23470, partial [Acidobacteria bacterium]|nr:hypothetical protein [Acidobacteriota bacterium]